MSATGEKAAPTPPSMASAPATASKGVMAVSSSQVESSASEGLSINQQLSNHLASGGGAQVQPVKPALKRKRGSLDQRTPISLKAQQPLEMKRIGFIGAGNIARAIAEGWISGGTWCTPP